MPKNVALCHIMKTGGSTLNRVLGRHLRDTTNGEGKLVAIHDPIKAKGFYRIAMFREPVSRVVSHYYQVKPSDIHSGGVDQECRNAAKNSFDSYMNRCRFASNLQTSQVAKQWGGGVSQPGVENKLAALRKYDVVLLTERFHESLVILHLSMGISVRNLLYWKLKDRSTRTKNDNLEVTPELRARILKRNQQDLQLWETAQILYNSTVHSFECSVADKLAKYEDILSRWGQECGSNVFSGNGACLVHMTPSCSRWKQQIVSMESCTDKFCENEPSCKADAL